MTGSGDEAMTLTRALREYVEARAAALLAARKSLRIGELDARALLYIVDHAGSRARDVGDYLGLTSAGTTTLIDRLVSRAAVRRDPDSADRRVIRLTATVDLESEPWAALTGFDSAFAGAVDAGDHARSSAAAELIAGFTRTATAR
jgi:DNA-binding MarR family transcriptional regulator